MKCPNIDKGGCPSKGDMNEHTNEWRSEYYCTTCGCEHIVKYDTPQKIVRDIPPPMPRRKKPVRVEQY